MTFNTYYTFHTDGTDVDLESIALHEFGHWLYLDHSSSSADVMYNTYDGIDRTLSQSDKNEITEAYGT
jgi:predicted Zn-dependent protease